MEIGKTLLSDGSVVSDDGTILVPASEIGRIMFKNTAPRIGKVMNPDGSIVEATGTGGGVFIRVFLETEHEYILEVINEGGDSFLTPNLKGSAHIGFY